MGLINTETELIFSIGKKDFGNLKSFLKSLDLRHGNEEVLDYWFSEGVWNLSTENGEEFMIVFGKEKIHIFLKKNKHFKLLSGKFFKYIKFRNKK